MPPSWNPTKIKLLKRKLQGNSLTLIVETDVGEGYLKVLNDKRSPHDLVCELVGTALAKLIGLPVSDYAILDVPASAPIELAGSAQFKPGPAFITRSQDGQPWSGRVAELNDVVNNHDFAKLVVFDTWVMNCDRLRPATKDRGVWCNHTNILLSREGLSGREVRLVPIDHECCFKCQKDLTPAHLRSIENDQTMFGFFKEFGGIARREDALRALCNVESVTRKAVDAIVDLVPQAWLSSDAHRTALTDLIYKRIELLRRVIEKEFPAADLTDAQPEGGASQ
jgi:hypothetical protein